MDLSNFPFKLKFNTYYILPRLIKYHDYTVTKNNPYIYVSRVLNKALRLNESRVHEEWKVSTFLLDIEDYESN